MILATSLARDDQASKRDATSVSAQRYAELPDTSAACWSTV